MLIDIDKRYIDKLEAFIASLPEGSANIKHSLDDEIAKRVAAYRSGKMKTLPFSEGLSNIREKLVSQL